MTTRISVDGVNLKNQTWTARFGSLAELHHHHFCSFLLSNDLPTEPEATKCGGFAFHVGGRLNQVDSNSVYSIERFGLFTPTGKQAWPTRRESPSTVAKLQWTNFGDR